MRVILTGTMQPEQFQTPPILDRASPAVDLLFRLEGEPCMCTRRGAAA